MEDYVNLKPDSDHELDEELNNNSTNAATGGTHEVAMDDFSGWNAPPVIECLRCHDFECMLPHGEQCGAPCIKFIVCPKCQSMCVTKASFDAHVATCLGAADVMLIEYELHIVKFDEPPCLVLCDACGMYKQRRGALMDAHRYICQRYVHEHTDVKFPYLPGELKWSVSQGAYTPPHYFHRLLAELRNGGRWTDIEARYFARSGAAECWGQTPCEAFRDLDDRTPVFPGTVMFYEADDDDGQTTDASSMTSCSTVSTAATSGTGQESAAGSAVTAGTAMPVAAPAARTPMETSGTMPRSTDGRVAHVEPQRQENPRHGNRRRRGRRSGQLVRERQQANASNTTPAGSAGAVATANTPPVGSAGALSSRSGRNSAPVQAAPSLPRDQARARDDTPRVQEGSRNRQRRPRGAPQQRTVNDVGGGALEIVSPRGDDDGNDRGGAMGDARNVVTSPSRQSGSHIYLEGAIIDHRNGNFIASVLVCGRPPNGTSNVVRRYELARYTAVGVSSGLQISYYRAPEEYSHLSGTTLSQARCQALLINTATRMPAGCLWFWEVPPVSGEWLLPTRGDARLNPGAEHIKMRFSPLRRG